MSRVIKKHSKKSKIDLSKQGYLYCCETSNKGEPVFKIGKTVNLQRRLEEAKTFKPDAKFVITCPPCKNQAEIYNFQKNYPRKMVVDHHLAERVIHILLKGYRIGNTECFSVNIEVIRANFKKIQRMTVDKLKNVIKNKKVYEELSIANKLLEEKAGMKFYEVSCDKEQDEREIKPEIHTDDEAEDEETETEVETTDATLTSTTEDDNNSSSDDEDEKFSDETKEFVRSVKDGILEPTAWGQTGLRSSFLEKTVAEQRNILRYLEISGIYQGSDDERVNKLKEWYQAEKFIFVKCRFPVKLKLKTKVKPSKQDKYLDELLSTYDKKFIDRLDDEKNSDYDDIADNYLSEIEFTSNVTIEGYLTCRMLTKWTDKNNKKNDSSSIRQTVRKAVTKIKKIATYIIDSAHNSEIFHANFKCETSKDPIIKYRVNGVDCYWTDYN